MRLFTYPKVSIILVNWNGLAHTSECLESLKLITYPNYHVIVVDNGSRGDEAGILEEKYGDYITLMRSDKNLGFAGGCNIGIRKVLEDRESVYALLLNNDTVVKQDFLTQLVRVAEPDRQVGIVGGKISYYDNPEKIWYAGGKIDLFKGNGCHISRTYEDGPEIIKVTFITGCMMLIKTDLFKDIGLLPEEYFLYVEDADFCYRATTAGYTLIVNSRAIIMHKIAKIKDYGGSPSDVYYLNRNRVHFMLQTVNKIWYVLPFIMFFSLSRVIKLFGWLMEGKMDYVNAMTDALRDGFRGKMGKRIA